MSGSRSVKYESRELVNTEARKGTAPDLLARGYGLGDDINLVGYCDESRHLTRGFDSLCRGTDRLDMGAFS